MDFLRSTGSVTGVDMSGEQLRAAEKNAAAAGLTNISFHDGFHPDMSSYFAATSPLVLRGRECDTEDLGAAEAFCEPCNSHKQIRPG